MLSSFFIILLLSLGVRADSPLTSTSFFKVFYESASPGMVQLLKSANETGVMTKEMAEFLASDNQEISLQVALINALVHPQDQEYPRMLGFKNLYGENLYFFMDYLKEKHHKELKMDDVRTGEHLSASEALSLAYLFAMGNFSNPKPALKWMALAKQKAPQSLTVAVFTALILGNTCIDNADLYEGFTDTDTWNQFVRAAGFPAMTLKPGAPIQQAAVPRVQRWAQVYGLFHQILSNNLKLNTDFPSAAFDKIMDYISAYKTYWDEWRKMTGSDETGLNLDDPLLADNPCRRILN